MSETTTAIEEKNICTCKKCGVDKTRKFIGKFDGRNNKYVDDNGKLWNGRVCPSCHKRVSRHNMKIKRELETFIKNEKKEQ